MLSFASYLSEAKNTHMTHIEDSVIYGGVKGTRESINALRELRDMLAGHTSSQTNVTVKWDGAPAVFCGIVPPGNENAGQFFVGKKSVFNKVPKYYTTPEEVDADTSGDLADKLKSALKYRFRCRQRDSSGEDRHRLSYAVHRRLVSDHVVIVQR